MKKSLYSIRDEVAEEFGEPFMAVNDNVARRCYLLGLSRLALNLCLIISCSGLESLTINPVVCRKMFL